MSDQVLTANRLSDRAFVSLTGSGTWSDALWQELEPLGLATANIGFISDVIACSALDCCALTNARPISVAQQISERLADLQRAHDIGEMKIKISGCINACGHHHGGQTALGGDATETAALGTLVGPAFPSDEGTVETIIATDLDQRQNGERFLDTWRRTGIKPFKEKLYAPH
jgi:sulfite reductase (NADPH) hemoprotein beta-component